MERSTTNPPTPLSLIGPFPKHEGRAALKALIMETTPVSICPYLSALVVAVPGRGLSHTKPTECLSVCLLCWPPCSSTYLNLNSNYLAVTTFLKHSHTKHTHTRPVYCTSFIKALPAFCRYTFVLCGLPPLIFQALTKHLWVPAHSKTNLSLSVSLCALACKHKYHRSFS